MVVHYDDIFWGGGQKMWDKMQVIRVRLHIGTEEEDNYPYLGNRLEVLPVDPRVPLGEFGVRLHQETYCDLIEIRILPRERSRILTRRPHNKGMKGIART